jgi:predicted lipoprotein with Yx(FWY)xxD motif
MKVIALTVLAVALTVALAACGGGSSSSSSSSSPSPSQLSVKQVDGVGSVLMDAQGHALYTPRQEAGGRLLCAKGCTAIWKPAAAVSGGAPDGVGKLGSVQRPDGMAQLTIAGRPAYTFAQDSPGKVTGDGVADAFAGRSFNWQAVKTAGSSSSAPKPSRGAYGY